MNITLHGQTAYAYTGGRPFDPNLPCIVFVHGALHDHSVWTLLARWFAHHGHAVLAVDLPGHGRSLGPAVANIAAGGRWILDLLNAAGVNSPVTLVGHSMGSLIALEAAAQAPDRCARLCLVGSAYPMKVSAALLQMAQSDPVAAMKMVNSFSHSSWAAKPGYPGPGNWLHGGNLQLMQRTQASYPHGNLFAHDFSICDGYAGGEAALASLTCPVHVFIGERDQMTTPKQGRALAQAIKTQVQTHSLPCGHALMSEAPDELLRGLRTALTPQNR